MSPLGKSGGGLAEFGSCCSDLHAALHEVPQSLFHVSEEGVLFVSVGMADIEAGLGFFDQAVIFCPFCGRRLQDKTDIGRKARDETH